MILALRTDKPEAELYLVSGEVVKDQAVWLAHRQLSMTLLTKIDDLLDRNNLEQSDIEGLVVFQGPGSFTGLRIGITVMNTLAYSRSLPIVGGSGDAWLDEGVRALASQKKSSIIMPHYGSEAHITAPRK